MKGFLKKRTLFLGLIVNITLVLLLGWIGYKKKKIYDDLNNLKSRAENIMLHTEKIRSSINRVENNSKGYVITGNEKYLETYNRTTLAIGRELEYLTALFDADESLKQSSAQLETLIDRKTEINNRFIEHRRQNGVEEKNAISSEEDTRNTNEINQTINNIQDKSEVAFQEVETKKELLSKDLEIASYVLLILIGLLLVAVYFILRYYLREKDISESLLEKNRHLLRSIIDNTTSPIFVKQINGQYLLVNKPFEFLFHISNEELRGRTDNQVFSREVANALRSSDLDVIKNEEEIKVEEKIPHNGELHTYLMVKFPIRDEEGKIYAIGAIATDITEREKLGVQIKTSGEEAVAIFNAVPEAIIVFSQDGTIIRWNKKSEELFGWKASEVLGKRIDEMIIPSADKQSYLHDMKYFLKAGEDTLINKSVELKAVTKENKEFDIEMSVAAMDKEGAYLFVAFIRDITARKQMEKEIRQSQLFLNSIIENIPDMMFVKDAKELRFVSLNTAGEKLLGYSAKEMLGKNDYDFFPKDQADYFTAKDREVLRTGELHDIPEEIIDTRNGKRWLRTKKIAIKDEKGNPAYLLGISENITEKKRLQDEKEQAEKLMRENEQMMKLILENIGEGVIVADNHEHILLSNRMAEDILHIDKETGSFDWSDKYHIYYPDGRVTFPAQNLPLEKALRNEPVDDMELVLIDPVAKTRKRVLVTGRPIRDEKNQVIAAVAAIRDVTKYKEMERALKETQTKYRNLIGFKTSNSQEE